jgi:threonylcarbamoyladenosine tRNA methylthiotransferase MtaB
MLSKHMATFSIENFGCRATEADAAALRRELLVDGLTLVGEHARADVVVLNTCTVTAAADSQARDAVRKIHRANPGAHIVVTGCYAQRAPEEVAALDGVAWVVGNSQQARIPGLVHQLAAGTGASARRTPWQDFVPVAQLGFVEAHLRREPAPIQTGDIFEHSAVEIAPAMLMAGGGTRPILKIQDGCNNRCAFCVIPFVRGRSRSLPPDVVVEGVGKLRAAGAKEIVLSGINLGSYGRDLTPRAGLADVVVRILAETEIEQVRFSSIEPQDISEDFVALVASSGRLAPHFHVPLQSGSDRILRAMHRWYRAEHYAERIKLIRRLLPDAAIGADVMAGFPGETDDDFLATRAFVEGLPFTYLHVFSFSPRPATKAAAFSKTVPSQVIRERARALRAIGQEKSAAFRTSQAGRTQRALTLMRHGEDWTEALTRNYLKVRIHGRFPENQWHETRLEVDASEVPDVISG